LRDARITVHQPDFGIRPYRALLGALAVKPDVVVTYSDEASMIDGASPISISRMGSSGVKP
jgi:hypothetical protein